MTVNRPLRTKAGSLSLVAIVVTTVLLALASSASSSTSELADPDDTPGPLDISSISHSHSERRLVHTITTHEGWDPLLLARPNAFFSLSFYFDGDLQRYVHVASSPDGTMYGEVRHWDGETVLGYAKVWKPDVATLRIEFPKRTLGREVIKYAWDGLSVYGAAEHEECDGATAFCIDEVPARGSRRLVHRLN